MKPSVLFQLTLCAAFVATSPALGSAKVAPKIHVVSSGQRLDSIAKRYGVSAAALRKANELRAGTALKAGQRLTIPDPERSDDEGARSRSNTVEEKANPSIVKAALLSSAVAPIRHRVASGETLGEIALRAGTTSAALAASNRLGKGQRLQVGQMLILPSVAKSSRKAWHPYAKPPKRKGYLDVSTPISRFNGPVLDSDGRLRSQAVRALNDLLGAGGTHPALPERLVRLLLEVSDTFAGRPIRLVSGYRTTSYFQDSRHKVSSAIDFLVVGVPNAVVIEYLRELEDVGVGYYPNSSFVHLDVRDHSAYWVDYAGPGEPPRSTPNAPSTPSTPRARRPADRKLLAELDSVLEQTTTAIEKARTPAAGSASQPRHDRDRHAESNPQKPGEHSPTAALDQLAMSVAQREFGEDPNTPR